MLRRLLCAPLSRLTATATAGTCAVTLLLLGHTAEDVVDAENEGGGLHA